MAAFSAKEADVRVRFFALLATATLLACGTPSAAPAPDVALPDAAVDAKAGDAGAAGDSAAAETAVDSTAPSQSSDAATLSGTILLCLKMATTICDKLDSMCCPGLAAESCRTHWKKACAKSRISALDDDALAAGTLVHDAAGVSKDCDARIFDAKFACDAAAVQRALDRCALEWQATAEIGQNCPAAVDLPCAKGKGRCSPKTVDLYVCTAAGGEGASCSATQPCLAEFDCLEGSLTRAKVCGKPGSTCNLSDKCWDGKKCDNGKCVADVKAQPATCAADADCPSNMVCMSGACKLKICLP